jgi:regulator of CtrA degradation
MAEKAPEIRMANIEFFDRTMLEAMSLLAESRRYLTDRAESESQKMDVEQGLANSMETMRLVARLTQVLAWLLTHRAVHAGEMSLTEATEPDRRLGGRDLCAKDSSEAAKRLPDELQSLLARSHSLYLRIARLDDQATARADSNVRAISPLRPQ